MIWLSIGGLIISGTLAAITWYYALITARMAKSMKEQTDAIIRPYVTVALVKKPNDPYIFLKISNTGKTDAKNLSLQLNKDFDPLRDYDIGKRLASWQLFQKPFPSFAPDTSLFYIIGFGARYLEPNNVKIPTLPFSITARYTFSGNSVEETTTLDVTQFNDTILDEDGIVKVLNEIKEEIKKKK